MVPEDRTAVPLGDSGRPAGGQRDAPREQQPKKTATIGESATMMTSQVFTSWDPTHSTLWGHQPIKLSHGLHQSPLFSREALAELIQRCPREHYSLIQTGPKGGKRVWREGEIGSFNGEQVMRAIAGGGLWLMMRDVGAIDGSYYDIVDRMFAEVAGHVPGFTTRTHQESLLVSSPDALVPYHADLPGQALIQLVGRKRVYVYPSTPPFITPEQLEDIALFNYELDLPYQPWFDGHARVFDIGPGEMLSWELNAPHRVENLDAFSVSMTVSYTTDQIRRRDVVNLANGLLRHRFGYAPKTRNLNGPSYFAKKVLQKFWRDSRWVKRERSARRPIEFRLDAAEPGGIVEPPKAA
jgi:hypothetical protein